MTHGLKKMNFHDGDVDSLPTYSIAAAQLAYNVKVYLVSGGRNRRFWVDVEEREVMEGFDRMYGLV